MNPYLCISGWTLCTLYMFITLRQKGDVNADKKGTSRPKLSLEKNMNINVVFFNIVYMNKPPICHYNQPRSSKTSLTVYKFEYFLKKKWISSLARYSFESYYKLNYRWICAVGAPGIVGWTKTSFSRYILLIFKGFKYMYKLL